MVMGVRSSSADEVNPFRNGLAPNVEILAERKRRGFTSLGPLFIARSGWFWAHNYRWIDKRG
jgi:hypothetical protein